MLVITADRPYELRDAGANQIIDQVNIFGSHVKRSFDLAPPSLVVSLSLSRATFEQALLLTQEGQKGPVHLNLQFREPVTNLPHYPEERWDKHESDNEICERVYLDAHYTYDVPKIFAIDRGLLAIGELNKIKVDQIIKLSEQLGWPIFADVTSGLRFIDHPNVLHHLDLAFINKDFLSDLSLKAIVRLGGRIVSKRFE